MVSSQETSFCLVSFCISVHPRLFPSLQLPLSVSPLWAATLAADASKEWFRVLTGQGGREVPEWLQAGRRGQGLLLSPGSIRKQRPPFVYPPVGAISYCSCQLLYASCRCSFQKPTGDRPSRLAYGKERHKRSFHLGHSGEHKQEGAVFA